MSRVREGFDFAASTARMRAQDGDICGMDRQLAAAHALAVWADTALLPEFDKLNAACWQEYEAWKTTTAG